MNRENIMKWAKESGAMFDHITWVERDLLPVFERFAELVRQDEREQAEYDNLTVKFGERAKEYLVEAKKSWQEPVAWAATSEDGVVEALGFNKSRRFDTPLYFAPDMSTKPENIDTSEECVHETDKSVHEDDDIQEYKRPWVGLTEEEVHKIIDDCTPDEAEIEELIDFSIAILAVEAKLKERNT